MVVSPEGRAIIAWWRRDASLAPTRDVVQIRRRRNFTAPFAGPVTLSRLASNFEARVDAAVAGGGLALVGWTQGTRAVALRMVPRTSAPPRATVIHEGALVGIDPLDVGVTRSGAAVAAWTLVAPGGTSVIRVAVRSASTGTWSGAGDLSAPGGRHPAVAVGPDGSAIVAWDRAGRIEASSIGPDGVVQGAPVILSDASDARQPAVALDTLGRAAVSWYQDGSVLVAERPAGGAFAAAQAVSEPGDIPDLANLGAPPVAMAADGRIVVAWRQRIGGAFRIGVALRGPDGAWTATRLVFPPIARSAGRPAVAMDASGRGVVTWSQPIGRSLSSVFAMPVGRGTSSLGEIERVSRPAGRGASPSVGIDASGRPVIAWREDPVGGPGRFIRAAIRFAAG